ncbi:hypothetical protein ICM05_04590 [Leucobacter sp. cx-42]|uniref:hypothetical protein n=1 Tax=unclassified Leucobacter TaxID=2621730 RepID=UPI00165D4C75|nr:MULTISPECIES: hypothetical protein [unclassified Leucobacter]MBC9953923.1 hypothetical protein [Leucobacter sp. cx-42]
MKKRILYFLLIVIAILVIAFVITWVASKTGMDFGPGLTVASSLALLAVTWSYVSHTKSLVDVEKEMLASQHKQSHYAAVSQMWGLVLEAEDTITFIRHGLRSPLEPDLSYNERLDAITTLSDQAKNMREHSSKVVRLLVDIEGGLEMRGMKSAGSMLDLGLDLMRYTRVLREELLNAVKESRSFSVENLVGAWENPELESDRSEARWSDYVAGKTIIEIDESITEFRLDCREEIRARGAA